MGAAWRGWGTIRRGAGRPVSEAGPDPAKGAAGVETGEAGAATLADGPFAEPAGRGAGEIEAAGAGLVVAALAATWPTDAGAAEAVEMEAGTAGRGVAAGVAVTTGVAGRAATGGAAWTGGAGRGGGAAASSFLC
jgi:hypothetical protein